MERRPTIMTVEEVAKYLRVHTMTIYRLIQRGDLPALRVGRGWRFKKDQIERWLLDHETNSHHPQPRTVQLRRTRKRRSRHAS
jgi:excisionase family DNA binding protein